VRWRGLCQLSISVSVYRWGGGMVCFFFMFLICGFVADDTFVAINATQRRTVRRAKHKGLERSYGVLRYRL